MDDDVMRYFHLKRALSEHNPFFVISRVEKNKILVQKHILQEKLPLPL